MPRIKLPKLPKRIKTKWVKALRSGKYVQTQARLYDGENEKGQYKMCCLGVLEHICGNSLENLNIGYTNSLDKPYSPDILRATINPKEKGFGKRWENLFGYMNDGVEDSIAGRKFKGAKTFKQIATYIEKNF